MASKALVLLGLFAFLLVVSEVAAASDTVELGSEKTVQPDHYGHGGHGGGCVGQGETGGGRCPHGCCRWFHNRCVRCCRDAGEAVQTQPDTVASRSEETVQLDHYGHGGNGGYNEGGSEGQGQRCGGCGRNRCCRCIGGRCFRCCHAGEANQTQPDTVDSGSEKTVQPDQYGHDGNKGYSEGGSEGQGQRCGGCGRNRCCRCIGGRCLRCCHAGEAIQTQPDTVDSGSEVTVQLDHYGHNSNGGYNERGREGQGKMDGCLHGCNHGCCSCVRGRCVRCCSHAGEAVQTQPDTVDSGSEKTVQHDQYGHDGNEEYNEGDSEGQGQICGGCGRHRCCRCIGGRCVRCCRDAGEAVIASSLGIEYL